MAEETNQLQEQNGVNETLLEAINKINENINELKKDAEKTKQELIKQNEAHAIDAQSLLDEWSEEDIYKQRLEMLEMMGKADRMGKINLINFDTDAMAAYMWVKKFGLSNEEVAKNFDEIKQKVAKLGSVGENFIKLDEAKKKYK